MIKKIFNKAMIVISILVFLSVPSLVGVTAIAASPPPPACSDPSGLTPQQQAQCGVNNVDNNRANNNQSDASNQNQLTTTIKNIINILLFLIGLIAVIMIVIAGFRFVTSNGDASTTKSARDTILYAVIGIVVAISAYAIVNFVLTNIT